MRKRPLCMVCLILLAIQLVRVTILQNTKDQKPSLAEVLIPDEEEVFCEGCVYKIETKSKTTVLYLKDTVISFTNQKNKNQKINEERILVTIKNKTAESGWKIFTDAELMSEQKEDVSFWKIGQKVQVCGEKKSFDTARNPGNFNQKSYYQRQGIHIGILTKEAQVKVIDAEENGWIQNRKNALQNDLAEIKNQWIQTIEDQMEERHKSILSAILLGEKNGLDPETKKLYQKNGLGHLLAISGLHMSLIGMSVYQILRKAGCSFLLSGISGGGILCCYLLLTGVQISSLRALFMFLIRMGAEITGRDVDQLTSLVVTATILSIYQPLYLTDASFLLSFGAILGIILLSQIFERKADKKKEVKERRKRKNRKMTGLLVEKLIEKSREGLEISFAVNGMLLGVLLYFYYEIPPYALVLNVFLVPLFPLVMLTGLGGIFLTRISEMAGRVSFAGCDYLLTLYDKICEKFSELPGSRVVTGQPRLVWVYLYYLIIFFLGILFYWMKWKRKKKIRQISMQERELEKQKIDSSFQRRKTGISLIVLFVMAGFVCWCRILSNHSDNLKVTMLDVGQGDCIFIRDRQGMEYLVDGGSSDVSSVGTYRIEPFLLSQGVDELEYVFATHGDNDHINGIQELLEDQKFGVKIRSLILPPEEYIDEKLLGLAKTAKEQGTKVLTIHAGEKVGMYLKCLGPATENKGTPVQKLEPGNEASTVLEYNVGQFHMLLTGDLEGEGEKQLVESKKLRECSVLKAGHHGSKNSGSEEFLRMVKPKLTLISAGRKNRYGHPHAETLERLEKIDSEVLSTQECGAITLISDDRKIRIEEYLR